MEWVWGFYWGEGGFGGKVVKGRGGLDSPGLELRLSKIRGRLSRALLTARPKNCLLQVLL
jgi:hypothetical protein